MWFDGEGNRKSKSGFASKTLANKYVAEQIKSAKKVSDGELEDGDPMAIVQA